MRRKLAAVLAADIVGYSKLMSDNESATLAALREFRANSLRPYAAQHRGEIEKSMGDGWIISFASAQDAVSYAIKLQTALEGHDLIRLRIGVHIGDMTREDEDVFGDGVNVASRLEALAPAGGVALSDAIYGMLDGTLRLGFADQGEQALKNIDRPIRVWMRAPTGAALNAATRSKTSGLPRLTVTPIVTSDQRDDVRDLAEELTADIALYLASVQWIETGEGYTLTQTLRARGDRLRLEVRLTSPDGTPIWSSKHDGDLSDVFDWQDKTGEAVASDIQGVILQSAGAKLAHLDDADMAAEQLMLKGLLKLVDISEPSVFNAMRYHSLAIEKDPSLAQAYACLIVESLAAHTLRYQSCQPYLAKLPEWIKAAEALAYQNPVLALLVSDLNYLQDFNKAKLRDAIESALICSPFDQTTLVFCGWGYVWMGDPWPALECFAKFFKLGRLSPYWHGALAGAANASVQAGRFEDALAFSEQGLKRAPDYHALHLSRAAALAYLGRLEEASVLVETALQLDPDMTVETMRATSNYGGTPEGERYLEGLLLAGFPQ